jgi:hypothetical protein
MQTLFANRRPAPGRACAAPESLIESPETTLQGRKWLAQYGTPT